MHIAASFFMNFAHPQTLAYISKYVGKGTFGNANSIEG